MKKKLPWLKYDMKKAEYLEAKDQEKDAKKKLDDAAKMLNELKEPIEKQKQEKKEHDIKCKKIRDRLDNVETSQKQMLEKENQLGAKVKGKYKDMEELERQETSRQERIAKAEKDLQNAELELENILPFEPPREKVEKLGAEILELEASAKEKRYQKKEKEKLLDRNKVLARQSADKLREMENIKNKRLQALKSSGADKIVDAYSWVQAHRHEFRKEVYGPVLVEVNISNQLHSCCLLRESCSILHMEGFYYSGFC